MKYFGYTFVQSLEYVNLLFIVKRVWMYIVQFSSPSNPGRYYHQNAMVWAWWGLMQVYTVQKVDGKVGHPEQMTQD
jgi:hypothetical protein